MLTWTGEWSSTRPSFPRHKNPPLSKETKIAIGAILSTNRIRSQEKQHREAAQSGAHNSPIMHTRLRPRKRYDGQLLPFAPGG